MTNSATAGLKKGSNSLGIQRIASPFSLGILGCVIFTLGVIVFWVGYIGSDDTNYWLSATPWLGGHLVAGNDHFSMRLTLVLPLAAARLALGNGPISLFVPTLAYAIGIVLLLTVWTERRAGSAAGFCAAVLLATNVMLVLDASSANIDIVEAFYVFLGLFCFDEASRSSSNLLLFLSGVSLALGGISRETSSFAVLTFCLMFLAGFAVPRWKYFIMGAGFVAVQLLEVGYYGILTGDMLHRWRVSAVHDMHINRWVDQGADIWIIHPLVDPITMLFLNHNFGLVAWVALPLAVWLLLRRRGPPSLHRTAALLATVGLCWSVCAAGLWDELTLIPRYFLFPL